jgi:hypothetical protein
MEQKTGTAALLAIIAAIGGFVVLFTGNPGWALVIELVAVALGVVGFFMAASPRVSGGLISIAAMIIGVLGVGVSVLGLIGAILF